VSGDALEKHTKTKLHKRRVKVLLGDRPHNKLDAELAGNMGAPDNGAKLRDNSGAVAMAI
jgi:bud site selection protein 20